MTRQHLFDIKNIYSILALLIHKNFRDVGVYLTPFSLSTVEY